MNKSTACLATALVITGLGCKPKADIPAAPMPGQNPLNTSALTALGYDPKVMTLGWPSVQKFKVAERNAYFAANDEAYQAFLTTPLGFDGMPAILFRLFADVVPDLWGPDAYYKSTGFHLGPNEGYPTELNIGPAKGSPFTIVNFSCGSCHTGYVKVGSSLELLVGAPSTTIDIPGYRRKLFLTVNDPRFTAPQFLAALAQKKPGWLYGGRKLDVEAGETAGFKAEVATIINAFKQSVIAGETAVQGLLGGYSFRAKPSQLDGGVPGSLDAFGLTVAALLMPPNFATLTPAEQMAAMKNFLPPSAPMVDIMSVWRQGGRNFAQWDGNIKNRLIRNLGAELGVIRDPAKVNVANAKLVTPFVANMPPPVYPFDVDLTKAVRGQGLYNKACKGCHDTEAFLPLAQIGTEPGRALGLTEASRQGLIKGLRAACSDATDADCQAPDGDILADRPAAPGYLSLPLSGIWARAPYFHNGSVPTLYHVLVPGERPISFKRGSYGYDQSKVGFEWVNEGVPFSTNDPGFSSAGHADLNTFFGGIDFSKDAGSREDLLEYLKTL